MVIGGFADVSLWIQASSTGEKGWLVAVVMGRRLETSATGNQGVDRSATSSMFLNSLPSGVTTKDS